MSSKFYIDDLRPAPDTSWTVIRNSRTALIAIDGFRIRNMHLQAVSLDHDLGGDDTTRPIMLYFCSNNYWPDEVYVHSANPVGVNWLQEMTIHYAPPGTLKRM